MDLQMHTNAVNEEIFISIIRLKSLWLVL